MTSKGTHHSEEVRQRISNSLKGNKNTLGYRHTEEAKKRISIASTGQYPSEATRAKISAAARKRYESPEARQKMSIACTGHVVSEETRKRLSEAGKRRVHSEETRKKISESGKGRKHSAETRQKMSDAKKGHPVSDKCRLISSLTHKGMKASPETRRKLSDAHSGEKAYQWKGGISYEPYCPKFNDALKEEIRDAFNRECYLCTAAEKNNKIKLCVHHCDYNKGQGCGQRWNLIPLCKRCHAKTNNYRFHYFNLLVNHWAIAWSEYTLFDPFTAHQRV